jgi:hypothetical protein
MSLVVINNNHQQTQQGDSTTHTTNLLCVVEEEVRVMRVGSSEDDGGGGERGGGLAGEVGARVVLVDAVRLARRRHVLGPLPAVVVRVAVTHLRAHRSVSSRHTVRVSGSKPVVNRYGHHHSSHHGSKSRVNHSWRMPPPRRQWSSHFFFLVVSTPLHGWSVGLWKRWEQKNKRRSWCRYK